jgi:ribosomal protein S18 acetylase RimI-like enzyme
VNQLPSVAAVYEQMAEAKRAGSVTTNFYPTAEKLQRWIDGGDLYSLTAANVLFILRRDRDFWHLYYLASHTADLVAALRELVGSPRETMTVDVLGKQDLVQATSEMFATVGFRPHCTLHRMTKTVAGEAPAPAADPEVVWADSADGPALAAMLEAMLDRHAEQIPDAGEMSRAAGEKKILVIRAGGAIAGQLFFEATGQSSILRHWVVDAAYRDRRVGARLMHRYFAECKDVRRFTLWVISDNDNAIDRYKHYGYQQDGLIDQVLMRQAV